MSNPQYQTSIFNIVSSAGYQGTQDQLFEMMKDQQYFNSVFNIVKENGFNGNERDFIFLAGVSPKKKDSAFSEEYSTRLGYGVEGGVLDFQTDSTIPPSEREDELSRLESRQKALEGDFFEGLFGDRVDPYQSLAEVTTGFGDSRTYSDEDIAAMHAEEQKRLIESYSVPGFEPVDADKSSLDYEVYTEAKKWLNNRGYATGLPVGAEDIESFATEIFDTYKEYPLFKATGTTKEDFSRVIANSGLLMDNTNTALAAETQKLAVMARQFDIGTYGERTLESIPKVEVTHFMEPQEDGNEVYRVVRRGTAPEGLDESKFSDDMGYFFEPMLDNINPAYVPTTEEELALAQARMPETMNTIEAASLQLGYPEGELMEENQYRRIAGYYNARGEVVQAFSDREDAIDYVNDFTNRYALATTEEEQKALLLELRENEASILGKYNEANEVFGLKRRAYDFSELVTQVYTDEIFMNADMAITAYKDSAEYIGKISNENINRKHLADTAEMLFFGTLDAIDMIGLSPVGGADDIYRQVAIDAGDEQWTGEYKDRYGRAYTPEFPSWSEISSMRRQARLLDKGVTLDQISDGIFGNDIFNGAGATLFLDGVGSAIPQIVGQIAMTVSGNPGPALAAFSVSSAGSAYNSMKDNPNLSHGEKVLYSSLMGAFEYVSEKIFMKQEVMSANAIRRMFNIGGREIAEEAAEEAVQRGVVGAVNRAWRRSTNNKVFKFFEEGIEESLVSFAGQHLTNYAERVALDREIKDLESRLATPGIADDVAINIQKQIAGKEIAKTNLKYNYMETLDAFAIGTAAGGIQVGVLRAPGYVASKFNLKDQIELENKYEALQKKLLNETNKEERKKIKQELLEVQDQMWRVSARDLAFLSGISDEDLTNISGLNTRIRQNRRKAFDTRRKLEEARNEGKADAVATYEAELQRLQEDTKKAFEEKFNIESKYSTNEAYIEQNLEDPELLAVINEVGRVDPDISDYGRVGRGNTVELTADNANSVIDRIINAGKIISTKFSTREEIIRGLKNVKNIIQTVVGSGGKVFIHGTASAFTKATGQDVSRGVHVQNGNEVHLFLPALKANTAYHEAFHSAAMQEDNKDDKSGALKKLSKQLALALPTPKRYLAFIREYLTDEQKALVDLATTDAAARKLLASIVEQNENAADELVTEILADITEGNLSVEYKQGLITAVKNYVARYFGEVKDPTMKQIVDAIKSVTFTMREGYGVAGYNRLMEAAEGLKGAKAQIVDEDEEVSEEEGTSAQRLAPNGKPSNLNPQQYETVRTPEFKQWFGDWENDPENASKAVDENGEPQVFYHGSASRNIEVFDRAKRERHSSGLREYGHFFATNQELSEMYAQAKPSEEAIQENNKRLAEIEELLNTVRNNRDFDALVAEQEKLLNQNRGLGRVYPVFLNLRTVEEFDAKGESGTSAWDNLEVDAGYKTATNRDAMEFLRDGFEHYGVKIEPVDGVIAKNIIDASVGKKGARQDLKGDVALVFDGRESAIKLADGSNQTFDPDNPNIKAQAIDLSNPQSFVENELMPALKGEGTFAHMTAEFPRNEDLSPEENAALNAKLKAILDERGHTYIEIDGFYDRAEKSFFVKNMSNAEAIELGIMFDQESVAHSDGMLYTQGENKGMKNPVFGTVDTDQGLTNYFSTIQTEEGPFKYSVNYNFKELVDNVTEASDGSKGEVKRQVLGENAILREGVKENLVLARSLEASGENAKTIRLATGWEKGVDGKWRYEISDGTLKQEFPLNEKVTLKLSEVLDNPELFEAYPDLADISVTLNVRKAGAEFGLYIPTDEGVVESIEVEAKSNRGLFTSLIHEVQHAIQFRELFATGGNLESAYDAFLRNRSEKNIKEEAADKEAREILDNVGTIAELALSFDEPPRFLSDLFSERVFTEAGYKVSDVNKFFDFFTSYSGFNEAALAFKEDGLEGFMEFVYGELEDLNVEIGRKWGMYGVYQRLAGEVEARNVEKRAFLDKVSTLESTEDVAREDQIIIFPESTTETSAQAISGAEVFEFVTEITPNEEDVPTGFEYIIKSALFERKDIELNELLESDPDFADYYNSREVRYAQDEVSESDLTFELVVVDGELLDGYSRASQMLRNGETTASAFVGTAPQQGESGSTGTLKLQAIDGSPIPSQPAPSAKSDTRVFAYLIQDKDLSEFGDADFLTNMYDFTTVGEVDLGNGYKIKLYGGKNYVPDLMHRRGLELGDVSNLAAFNTLSQVEAFIRNAQESGASLFSPHSGTMEKSWQFQHAIFEELVNLVLDKKIISKKALIKTFNDAIKVPKTKKNKQGLKKAFVAFSKAYYKKTGKKIRNLSSFLQNPLELVELLNTENNFSPDLRKLLNDRIISNNSFKKKLGLDSKLDFAEKILDPLNKGVEAGDLMGVIEFDNTTLEIRKPEKGDIDYHPSFAYTVTAKITGIYQPTSFYKSYDVTDSYTKFNVDGPSVVTPTDYNVREAYDLAVEGKQKTKEGKIKSIAPFEGTYEDFQRKAYIQANVLSSAGSILKKANLKSLSESIQKMKGAQEEGNAGNEAVSQQKIVETVADMLTEEGFSLKMKGRGKNKTLVLEKTKQVNLYKLKKDEIIAILEKNGMTKEEAETTYKNATQYAKGRRAARKEAAKIAAQARRKQKKLSTEAKNLREELQKLKEKSKSLQDFFKKAQALIKERVKQKNVSNRFTAAQLKRFFAIAGQMARTSAKRLSENELDIIDSYLDKLAEIFDQQEAKKVMEDHLKLVKAVRALQKTLLRKAKQRDFRTYSVAAAVAGKINASLIPIDQLESFSKFINSLNDSMKRARFSKDEDGNLIVTPSELKNAKSLLAIATNFKGIEENERDASFRRRADKAVAAAKKVGQQTTFKEEYQKILDQYERSKLSPTRKKIVDMAKKLGLDPDNVQDLETILDEIAKDSSALTEEKKELILSDSILPRIAANIDELLQDKSFRTIFGLYSTGDLDMDALRARLMRLDMKHLAALEYKISDYLVNGSVNGLGYLAAIVRGKISLADDIKTLVRNGVRSKSRSYGSVADNVPSFLRNVFKVSNVTLAKIMTAIGLQDLMSSVNLYEQAHIERVRALQNKIEEIEAANGEVTSDFAGAIAQIFSMARQIPQGLTETEWFMNLRNAMAATIKEYEVEMKDVYTADQIKSFRLAYDYLFEGTNTLQELLNKVNTERTDIVELVDFMAQLHDSMREQLESFTSRYLGKALEVIENYTPFKVRKKGFDEKVDSVMEIRKQLISALSSAGTSNYTRTPGATFERESRAVGADSIIGLNFLSINEGTMRQNAFIMQTLEDVLALKYAFSTEEIEGLMPKSIRGKLSTMIDNYLVADATEVPFIFQKYMNIGGRKIRNPFELFRVGAVIQAFGGLFMQFFKQSTVMIAALMNTKTLQGKAYLIRSFGELLALTFVGKDQSGKYRYLSDPRVKLDKGRYNLLRHTTLFIRDYKAGNIDPFTGRVEFDKGWFEKTRDFLQDKSMWTLTTTDKVAAISSFFAFYADYMLTEGLVNDISEINWEQESVNPNRDAIAYAENMVSKDQNVSSSRLAANIYKNKSAFVRFLVQTMVPFQSFAINTKRSITADIGRIIDSTDENGRKDGVRGLVGTMASLYVFAYISRISTAMIAEIIRNLTADDDDDELELEGVLKDPKILRESGVQTVLDALPLPSTPMIDNSVKDIINYYLLFNLSDYSSAGLEDKDAFALFKEYGDAVTTYNTGVSQDRKPVGNALLGALSFLGPGGKFMTDIIKTAENTLKGGESYTTGSGKERYIRPEDQQDFMLSNALRTLLLVSNIGGVGLKELDYVAKALDDMPKDRALSSEEELAAFEVIVRSLESDPEFRRTLSDAENIGVERLMSVLKDQAQNDPVTLARGLSAAKFNRAANKAVGDKFMEMMYPREYSRYSGEVRRIANKSPKEIAAIIRGKQLEMNSEEFERYNNFLLYYLALSSEATLTNVMIELQYD